ncbi:MAG TPA: rhodanese-related sulfurtransferase [Methylococcales bacterium]|jgi:UPF0176 protein|nr:rhodanese-related sulfurtransferase [Methylococcales bacterium]
MVDCVVTALYKFVRLEDFEQLQKPLLSVLTTHEIKGTILLAKEGINGTVAGSRAAIDALYSWFENDQRLVGVRYKESFDETVPFYRTKVKLKKEIVTMGVETIDPNKIVGTYVKPSEWNALISDPDVLLVDTRNDYEVNIGQFQGAVNPKTETFREFPQYVKANLNPEQHKKVAMYCTGGIRCEKSTAYLKEQGFEAVYHLEGGILKYLEEVPKADSMWQGECFVFDNRVAVDHSLVKGQYDQCFACRYPVSEADKASEHYIQGVSCPHCFDKVDEQQRQRFKEREKQMELSRARGVQHIGSDVNSDNRERRGLKYRDKEKQRQRVAEKKRLA